MTLQKQIEEQLPELTKPKPIPVPYEPLKEPPLPPPSLFQPPYDWKTDDHYNTPVPLQLLNKITEVRVTFIDCNNLFNPNFNVSFSQVLMCRV